MKTTHQLNRIILELYKEKTVEIQWHQKRILSFIFERIWISV